MSKKVNEAVVNEENIVEGEVTEEKVEKTFGQKVGDGIDKGIAFGKKVVTSKPAKVIGGIALIGGAVFAGAALFGKNGADGEIEAADDLEGIDTTQMDTTPIDTIDVETADVTATEF